MSLRDFGVSAPVYVTNPTAGKFIAHYSMPLWMSLLAMFLAWMNAVVWGVIGLYVAVKVVV